MGGRRRLAQVWTEVGSKVVLCLLPGESLNQGTGWRRREGRREREGRWGRKKQLANEWALAISRTLLPHFPDGVSEA